MKSGSSTSAPPPSPPLMALHLACGICVHRKGWGLGDVAEWQLSRQRQASLATATRYMITDHRHAPSKHNSGADKRVRPRLHVCLLASAAPGRGTLKYIYKNIAPADAVHLNHMGIRRRASHPPRVSSNHLSFLRIQWKASLPKVSFTASQRNEFDCDKRSLKNMRVYATARASVPAAHSIWGQVGRRRWWYGLWGGIILAHSAV